MRFYTKQHPFYCGIDLHARTMYLCVFNQDGERLVHRNMPAGPAPLLKAIAPYQDPIVVAVACLFPWYWLADLWAREGMPFVLGPALSMKAIHGGKATNDKSDAQKIAVFLRGGLLPQAYVSPADMRATRELLRRRMPLMRKRAALLAHIHKTNSQYNVPELGKTSAYKANRDGVAARFPAPAVQKSLEVARALLGHDDQLLHAMALSVLKTAQQHDAKTRSRLRTVPGIGELLSLGLRYAIHDLQRLPRMQDFVAYCRLGKGAREAAGQRYGTAGTKSGNASLPWAFSAAAVLLLRAHPAGQKYLAR
jgi:transposase